MKHESLGGQDWPRLLDRLGGVVLLEQEARATGAFKRIRGLACGIDLLRLVLTYCLSGMGLRLTAGWAEAIGFASISNVAVLKRVRKCTPWLEAILARQLMRPSQVRCTGKAAKGRLIRLVDATTVAKKSRRDRQNGGVWRVHAVFDLGQDCHGAGVERFSVFELTDEREGERADRAAVVPGEIRIMDRGYMQPDRLARLAEAGADFIVRAPWNGAGWLDKDEAPFNLIGTLMKAKAKNRDVVDCPVWIRTSTDTPLGVRFVALRKPDAEVRKSQDKVEAEARAKGRAVQPETVVAAGWVILVTTLPATEFSAGEIGDLYRLRWRIEIAFKHLKSGLGLDRPPSDDPDVAKAMILAHLILEAARLPLSAPVLGLFVHPENPRAIKFYERAGFQAFTRTYTDPVSGVVYRSMIRQLAMTS